MKIVVLCVVAFSRVFSCCLVLYNTTTKLSEVWCTWIIFACCLLPPRIHLVSEHPRANPLLFEGTWAKFLILFTLFLDLHLLWLFPSCHTFSCYTPRHPAGTILTWPQSASGPTLSSTTVRQFYSPLKPRDAHTTESCRCSVHWRGLLPARYFKFCAIVR